MNNPTIGCAIVAAPNENLLECINSLTGQIDDIVVFTWDSSQELLAESRNIRVEKIEPINHVELIRQKMQSALSTDWVLILDPDELVKEGGIQILREQIAKVGPEIVGLWIPYQTMFLGTDLKHSFSGLWQMRLFKRDRVFYTNSMHQNPIPINGHFEFPNIDGYIISHKFVTNLKERFERHLLWAQIEAQEMNDSNFEIQDPGEFLDHALEEIKYYLIDKNGLQDGTAGLLNALMHGWKKIATLAMLWELQGAENKNISQQIKIKRLLEDLDKASFNK